MSAVLLAVGAFAGEETAPVPYAVRAARERDAIAALEAAQATNRAVYARANRERSDAFMSMRQRAGGWCWDDPDCAALMNRIRQMNIEVRGILSAKFEANARHETDEFEACEIEQGRARQALRSYERQLDERYRVLAAAKPGGPEAVARFDAAEAALAALQTEWETRRREIGERTRALEVRSSEPRKPVVIDLELPPLPDAAERMRAFATRNGPASLAALATNFFRLLDPAVPGVGPAVSHFRAGRPAEALDAYRDYFFEKVTRPSRFGIAVEAFTDDEGQFMSPRRPPPAWIDGATQGIAHVTSHELGDEYVLRVRVGPPGAVHWAYVADNPVSGAGKRVWLEFQRRFGRAIGNDGGTEGLRDVLLDAYAMTGRPEYVRRWAGYADDWAMHWQDDVAASTNNLRYYDAIIPRLVCGFVSRMRSIAIEQPAFAREVPGPTLARVLIRLQEEYLAPNILVARTTRQNWNMMGLGFNARNEALLPEFLPVQWAGREARRCFESAFVFTIMPDGGSVEYVDEGHQGVWRERTGGALRLWRRQPPRGYTPGWEAELRESFDRNARFWVRHLAPDGYQHRDGFRYARPAFFGRAESVYGPQSLDGQAPWVLEEPEVRRVLGTVFGGGTSGAPEHVSDVMPNLGEFVMRGGWERDAPMFYMSAGRTPNSNAAEDATAYSVHAFGRHLFYGSPVYVEGRSQNAHFAMVDNVGSKTSFLSYSDGRPSIGRWHTSASFDVAEGFYQGAYEDRRDRHYLTPFKSGGSEMSLRHPGEPPVTDVRRHTRQVFFVRRPLAWIVSDRIETAARHRYEMPYEFYTPVDRLDWLRRSRVPIPEAARRVVADAAAGSLATHNPGWPNVTIRHFAAAPVRYEFDPRTPEPARASRRDAGTAADEWRLNRPELRDTLAFSRRVFTVWEQEGDHVLVSLVQPRAADAGEAEGGWRDLRALRGEGGIGGFEARAPDGTRIAFATGPAPAQRLSAGGLSGEAESLLWVEEPGAAPRGVALGIRSLALKGRSVRTPAADVEFRIAGDRLETVGAIHGPIEPVEFDPPVNVFTDEVAVTLRCATSGVQIRYSLDGSDPTPRSPLYRAPVRLDGTVRIKAMAMRPGIDRVPWELRPGLHSLPTWAVFTRQTPLPAVTTTATEPGLGWEYFEGPQFALVPQGAIMPAAKSGTTASLMDVGMRATGGPFGVRYRGFLRVPADGVYTFHAPREFVMPDLEAGYDLRVFVDGLEWDPARRRHAMGSWSVALASGDHAFEVVFVDTRSRPYKYETWRDWPSPQVLWQGTAPVLEISGPGMERQPVPAAWLRREVRANGSRSGRAASGVHNPGN